MRNTGPRARCRGARLDNRALQPVGLNLGVDDDARVVDALTAGAKQPQEEFVVFERPDAVSNALDVRCKDANRV